MRLIFSQRVCCGILNESSIVSLSLSKLYYKVKTQYNTSSAQLSRQVIEHISSRTLRRPRCVMQELYIDKQIAFASSCPAYYQ